MKKKIFYRAVFRLMIAYSFQVVDFHLDREQKILGLFPKVIMTDKGSYVESSTKQYDQLAFKYLSWLLFPLLGGYACYSLLYLEHKGWYSWVLNMLYSFLLTFGEYFRLRLNLRYVIVSGFDNEVYSWYVSPFLLAGGVSC